MELRESLAQFGMTEREPGTLVVACVHNFVVLEYRINAGLLWSRVLLPDGSEFLDGVSDWEALQLEEVLSLMRAKPPIAAWLRLRAPRPGLEVSQWRNRVVARAAPSPTVRPMPIRRASPKTGPLSHSTAIPKSSTLSATPASGAEKVPFGRRRDGVQVAVLNDAGRRLYIPRTGTPPRIRSSTWIR